jgi:plastocyanin
VIRAAEEYHFFRRAVARSGLMILTHDKRPGAKGVATMRSSFSGKDRQGMDYHEKANVHDLHAPVSHEETDVPITIKPFSLRVLGVCGLTIFFVAFFSSRYGIDFTDASATQGTIQSQPTSQTARADANPATTAPSSVADASVPAVVHVVMRNMKFDPATVEVKSGDVVEWKNEDITPHTATSASFDSASIDPDKSWKHTFSGPGNFPYACTFHPDMKAIVTVK